MKTRTKEELEALQASIDAFEQTTTGVWKGIEEHMRDSWGIDDPEAALEDANNAPQA